MSPQSVPRLGTAKSISPPTGDSWGGKGVGSESPPWVGRCSPLPGGRARQLRGGIPGPNRRPLPPDAQDPGNFVPQGLSPHPAWLGQALKGKYEKYNWNYDKQK